MATDKIIGKYILEATVKNTAPLLVGSGRGDETDFEVIKDASGYPLIPASGFAGMLMKSLDLLQLTPSEAMQLEYFRGSSGTKETDVTQSHIIIHELKINDGAAYVIGVRDSVKINQLTGTGIPGAKFDYEIVEPGVSFQLYCEVTVREQFDGLMFRKFLEFIAYRGMQNKYVQGAFKSSGFGMLAWSDIRIYGFDFSKPGNNDADAWFAYLSSEGKKVPQNLWQGFTSSPLPFYEPDLLVISGDFEIRNSLIIRSDGNDTKTEKNQEKEPDKIHLTNSEGVPLLTGKSLKGPLRHRCLKILKTLDVPYAEKMIDELFGFVNESEKSYKDKAGISKVRSFEQEVIGAETGQVQPRIKVDRFTGGTVEHALMQTQPLWHKNECITIRFEVQDPEPVHAGLLLLAMKDLFHGDLPIGGEKQIGRGVLKGRNLRIGGTMKGTLINMVFNEDGLLPEYNNQLNLVKEWITAIKP